MTIINTQFDFSWRWVANLSRALRAACRRAVYIFFSLTTLPARSRQGMRYDFRTHNGNQD